MEVFLETENIIILVVIVGLIVVSGFFSGSETALTAASRARIHAKAQEGDKRAQIVARLLERRERLIGALLLGNNLVNILASSLMAGLMLSIFGDAGILYATAVMTLLILIFAEVLPKTYAISRPDKAAMTVAWPVGLLVKVFAPIVAMIQFLVNGVLRLFGVSASDQSWTATEEIRSAINLHHSEGSVEKSERDQIVGVLTIGDLRVDDVMIHRKNLVMIEAGQPAAHMIKQVLKSGYTRLPVWRGDKDNVIGVLHAKELLKALSAAKGDSDKIDIGKIIREPWFVPETTPVVTQLRFFQQKREHFALAVDEYGALMGVVTLEDILEEIVGDIQDEFDHSVQGVRQLAGGAYQINGDVPVRDLNRALDWKLPDEEAVTLAGLLIHESQTIPDIGHVFSFYGFRFEILGRVRNQITSIKVGKHMEAGE